jgi:serine phosphatase RsbU (regulator of sigma subunit)
MVRQEIDTVLDAARREATDIGSTLRDAATSVRDSIKGGSIKNIPRRINEPSGFNPVKFKKLLITVIKLLIVFEFLGAIADGAKTNNWSRLGLDCLIAGAVYLMWDRIKRTVAQKKEEYRRKVEASTETTKLLDALAFSLLWSDEIYQDIPLDMRRLVVISYTLIAISIGAIFVGIGQGLVGLIVCGSLILGAVNLLAWVMSRERGEKDSLKTELKLAHDVQVSLMPKEHPHVEGFDIAGLSMPAKEVGGDHFDYACLDGDTGRFCISVFDVSGKGMQAAMSAVFTSGAFASEVTQSSSAATILTHLNKAVYTHSKRGHFVAFLLGILDVDRRELTFANAGQTKPLLKANGSVEWLNAVGVSFPLGMKEDSAYNERTIQLRPGDVVLFLTDGFTEAMNAAHEQFGTERLQDILQQMETDKLTAIQILERITSDVQLHVGAVPQHDDMTMVVVKVASS